MNGELGRIWSELAVANAKALFWNSPGGTKENHKRSQSG
jgi:hypothetical protein